MSADNFTPEELAKIRESLRKQIDEDCGRTTPAPAQAKVASTGHSIALCSALLQIVQELCGTENAIACATRFQSRIDEAEAAATAELRAENDKLRILRGVEAEAYRIKVGAFLII